MQVVGKVDLLFSQVCFNILQVDVMDSLFRDFQTDPPLYKNQPPAAGSIYWEKSLFLRIKHTIVRFQTLEEMMQTDQGKAVSSNHSLDLFHF